MTLKKLIQQLKDLETLNKNFNLMTDKLKNQQEKLIINERHEAWGNLARKLAHEIKNPLTPIQLTIDRIKDKYLTQLSNQDQNNFKENLKIINNQIKQIENLVNEFSDFARMPKPILKDNDLIKILLPKSQEDLENEERQLDSFWTAILAVHDPKEPVEIPLDDEMREKFEYLELGLAKRSWQKV